jgi:CO/xanthine dehydrogenase Mo-binding subunit
MKDAYIMSIGQSKFRVDASGKVTGDTLYPADIIRENYLHAKVVFSGKTHARMLAMDLSAAETIEGILGIFTAKDVPVNEYGLTMFDQPVLVGLNDTGRSKVPADVSRFEGEQVAIVIAETQEAAQEAAEAIVIEWEDLPLVTDVLEALKDEILVHPEAGTNSFKRYVIRKGDMEIGWKLADVIVEGRYEVPHQEHAFLQPEAAISYIDDEGRITVEIGGQWTHEDQEQVAHALDMPAEKIRIIYPAIGGAFGGREDMSFQIVLALASWKLHEQGESRPIRAQWSREESMVGHHKRHRAVVETRWGATKEGKIVAVEADVYLDAGAYNYTSNKVLGNFHLCVAGPYEIPNARIDSSAIYTTTIPGGAFRGFGAPQGAFAAENQMNKLAEKLGIDPVELRLKNTLNDRSIALTQTPMPAGVSIAKVVEECAKAANWDQPLAEAEAFQAFASLPASNISIRRGRGIACSYKNVGFSFGFPERCVAKIELHGNSEIERAILYHSAAEVGQGTHTVLKQMTATALDVDYDKIELIMSDTAFTGDSGSVSASRMTFMAGNSIIGAAEKALDAWQAENRPAIGEIRFTPRPTEMIDDVTGKGDANISYGYVAEAVELSVDIETGHIFVERVVCANDVGHAINPNLVVGQIEGAVVQAYGYTITENLKLAEGHILNPRFSTYLIPGIRDIPAKVESVIVEEPDPQGPWGARGMAEMPFIPLAPAITAALYDATGVWFDKIPLTPENVVKKLREQGIGAE